MKNYLKQKAVTPAFSGFAGAGGGSVDGGLRFGKVLTAMLRVPLVSRQAYK